MNKNPKSIAENAIYAGYQFGAFIQHGSTMDEQKAKEAKRMIKENLSLMNVKFDEDRFLYFLEFDIKKEETFQIVRISTENILSDIEKYAGDVFADWFELSLSVYLTQTMIPEIEPMLPNLKKVAKKLSYPDSIIADLIRLFEIDNGSDAVVFFFSKSLELIERYDFEKRIVCGYNIFLVHGHNDSLKESVARFLEKMDFKVTILHETPNHGLSIIEKFEKNSNVGFSVVLLTGDDKGGIASSKLEDMKLRGRQNVIFELGYFIGKLGRNPESMCTL